MKNKFYKIDYVPNKLVYVYDIKDNQIMFLSFFNEGNGMQAIKHSMSTKSKKDFKKVSANYNPIPDITVMINEVLKPTR